MESEKGKRLRKRIALLVTAALILAAALFLVIRFVPFGSYDLQPQGGTTLTDDVFDYDLPLDPGSPWPKFRANTLQNGRTPVEPTADSGVEPWEVRTAKGIFSSPVIDGEGTAYVGSADRFFYAIALDGTVKWKVETGEIIDSSAVLDDRGRVYFGSGDAKVYCLDQETGTILWTQQAATTDEVNAEFGIKTYNVNWFEGNLGIMPDGTILAPNDNYLLYRLDRNTGDIVKRYLVNEMIWSLPSQNLKTGSLFFGTMYPLSNSLMSYEAESGKLRWRTGGIGGTAATTLLTSYSERGGIIAGSYDGTLRCLAQDTGKTLWKRTFRDHIYASPAQLSDGTIIQPCTDGTVYALDPENGDILWAFDTLEPIRSSPAVDANDQIYFGSGEGKLFCLNSDGSLRWYYQCILEGRNDLNASPALGFDGVYIAGESGEIFFVPYDYPLRPENAGNARCGDIAAYEAKMPGDGGHMIYTDPLGGLARTITEPLQANHSLAFTLIAREDGRTVAGQIGLKSLKVSIPGNDGYAVQVSADKRYMMVVPDGHWVPDTDGNLKVEITGEYKTGLRRIFLFFFGGKKGGDLKETYTFAVPEREASENPFVFPDGSNTLSSVIELRRQAAPNPSMLPSLAQIGFDSLHYLTGAVGQLDGKTLFWVIGGRKEADGSVVPDPASGDRFPLLLDYSDGLATFSNHEGLVANFVSSWDVPITSLRVGAAFDPETRLFDPVPTYNVTCSSKEIAFYGPGMRLLGLAEMNGGLVYAVGSLELAELEPAGPPEDAGTVQIRFEEASIAADISGSGLKAGGHVYGLLVTSPEEGRMVALPYAAAGTAVGADENGMVTSVTLNLGKKNTLEKGKAYDVYFIVDTYPVDVQTIVY